MSAGQHRNRGGNIMVGIYILAGVCAVIAGVFI